MRVHGEMERVEALAVGKSRICSILYEEVDDVEVAISCCPQAMRERDMGRIGTAARQRGEWREPFELTDRDFLTLQPSGEV